MQKLRKTGYEKWISKRNDKLADYETARSKRCTLDELERLRCEFEALNTHVKTNVPKIYNLMNEVCLTYLLFGRIINLRYSF